MDEGMVQGGIEDGAFRLRASFNEDTRKVIIPLLASGIVDGIEVLSMLFGIEILSCICNTDK